ncbi:MULTISPECIES: hypothetical protein [unclassified Streptomyces]|uniref:hypothetical protein n=1 Tax=unclassified Streptomyces TaxID=2593676 RepID=UPI001CD2D483|nr:MULTISPECIES: hypothetical protein [unclassified Streptomyces]
MSETTERTPLLATLDAFEAAASRTVEVARRLINDHPDLPLDTLTPILRMARTIGADGGATHAARMRLQAATTDPDAVRAWARALGAKAESGIEDGVHALEWAEVRTWVDGVHVEVVGWRTLPDEEVSTQLAQASAEPSTAGVTGGGL